MHAILFFSLVFNFVLVCGVIAEHREVVKWRKENEVNFRLRQQHWRSYDTARDKLEDIEKVLNPTPSPIKHIKSGDTIKLC